MQYVAPFSSAADPPSSAGDPLRYSQFYRTTSGPAPSNAIGTPQRFEIAGSLPSILYLGEKMQPVPYSQYWVDPVHAGTSSLWIKGATDWTQYAVVPQGSTLSLIAISPKGGSGILIFEDPSGQTHSQDCSFYPDSLLTFYADKVGQYILSFAVNGQLSNIVKIDVTSSAPKQPTTNLPWENYYPAYYPWDYYPWFYYPPGYYLTCAQTTSAEEDEQGKPSCQEPKEWIPSVDHKEGIPKEDRKDWIPGRDEEWTPAEDHKIWVPKGDGKDWIHERDKIRNSDEDYRGWTPDRDRRDWPPGEDSRDEIPSEGYGDWHHKNAPKGEP
jgi:hypothetical protein